MLAVELADVILQEIPISKTESLNESLAILWNSQKRQVIIVDIDESSAIALTLAVNRYKAARPLTHDFIAHLLSASETPIRGVTLHAMDGESSLIARVQLQKGEKTVAVRGSVGDVLTLALQLGCEILVDDSVWKHQALTVPSGYYPNQQGIKTLFPQLRKSYEMVRQRWYWYVRSQRSFGFYNSTIKGYLYDTRQRLRNVTRWVGVDDEKIQRDMIPLQVLDVTFQANEPSLNAIVLLWADSYQKAILIAVGVTEGLAIVDGMMALETAIPSAHQFCANLLHGTSATIKAVVISALQEEIYYATVYVETDTGVQLVDARSSDAIALAVYLQIPIYVSAKVMSVAQYDIKPPSGKEDKRFQQHLTAFDRYRRQLRDKHTSFRQITPERAQQILKLTFESSQAKRS